MKKLQQFFTKTLGMRPKKSISVKINTNLISFLDTNNDGLVNWTDFEAAIEVSYFITLSIDKKKYFL